MEAFPVVVPVECGRCGNIFHEPEIYGDAEGVKGQTIYLCYGCNFLGEDQMGNKYNCQLASAILHRWRPDDDRRFLNFLRKKRHPTALLVFLKRLSKYYTWKDTARMANSIAMERIRHDPEKARSVIAKDFETVYFVCESLRYAPTNPEKIGTTQLQKMNMTIDDAGLMIESEDREYDQQYKGVCTYGEKCQNVLPKKDRIIFTEVYRCRGGCVMIA